MRALTLLLLFTTLPGCGFLFTTIADATHGSAGPITMSTRVSGRTSGRSHHPFTCGGAAQSPQNEHPFVAPADGTYTFDSTTTDYDGVLGVFDASDNQLACNDDHSGTRASEVVVSLSAGQVVTVVQGGYLGASGSYEMWVTPTDMPSGAPTGQITLADGTIVPVTPAVLPQPLASGASVMGDTSGLGTIGGVTCPPTSPMQEWTFTAPADGSFVFQLDAMYDAYLGVIDALGTQLGCNDDFGSSSSSRVAVDLAQGNVVRVIVGGFSSRSGAYSLTAVQVTTGGPITLGQPVLFAPGHVSNEHDVCGAVAGSVDRTFTFTPPAEAFYAFTTDASGILVIGDGRRTAACITLTPQTRAGFVLKAGHRYSLVLELGGSDGMAHTFSIDRIDPDAPDWQVPPQAPPIAVFTRPLTESASPP